MNDQATRLFVIRHGRTAWNVQGIVQGHTDIGLDAFGHWQAAQLAHALADETLQAVYSSDLARARDTAAPLAQRHGLALRPDQGLRERAFGEFEGSSYAQIAQRWPEQAERWRRREPDWAPPGAGGESLLQFRERVAQAVQALAAENMGNHIALFTHGGVLDVLYRLATGLDLQAARSWQIGNAAVNRLLWTPDSGLSLVGWADTTHLEDESLDERFS